MNPARTRRGFLLLCILIATVTITVVPALADTSSGNTTTITSADTQETLIPTGATDTSTAANEASSDAGTVLTEDIPPYDGSVGPDSALYGLKLAFEDLDESFTFDPAARLDKQVNRATLRLSEAKRELQRNNSQVAALALEQYYAKVNATAQSVTAVPKNATGLLNAQEMIAKHQYVLENLISSHQNNTGLRQAYANSVALELKFQNKTQLKVERNVRNSGITLTVRPVSTEEQLRTEAEIGRGDGNTQRVRTEDQEQWGNVTGAGATGQQATERKPDAARTGNGNANGTGNSMKPDETLAPVKTPPGQNTGTGNHAGSPTQTITQTPTKTPTPSPAGNAAGTNQQNGTDNTRNNQQGNSNKK